MLDNLQEMEEAILSYYEQLFKEIVTKSGLYCPFVHNFINEIFSY